MGIVGCNAALEELCLCFDRQKAANSCVSDSVEGKKASEGGFFFPPLNRTFTTSLPPCVHLISHCLLVYSV